MSKRVKVKQQTECRSKNWGVYVDGSLVEGGFFTKGAAVDCASKHIRDLEAPRGRTSNGWDDWN